MESTVAHAQNRSIQTKRSGDHAACTENGKSNVKQVKRRGGLSKEMESILFLEKKEHLVRQLEKTQRKVKYSRYWF
jgi:hypothetical protein